MQRCAVVLGYSSFAEALPAGVEGCPTGTRVALAWAGGWSWRPPVALLLCTRLPVSPTHSPLGGLSLHVLLKPCCSPHRRDAQVLPKCLQGNGTQWLRLQ